MHPVIQINIGDMSLTLISYELFTVLAALAGSITAFIMLRNAGIRIFHSMLLLSFMASFFLIGARLWNYAVLPESYGEQFGVATLRLSGFSLYGGITGAAIVLLLFSRILKYDTYSLLDAFVLPSGIAFALARIGCYLNGCCSGKVTRSFLGVYFPQKDGTGSILDGSSIPLIGTVRLAVYPTQLFEMTLALAGLLPAMWLYRSKKYPAGVSFLFYGIWTCTMRWIVLYFRLLPYPEIIVKYIYPMVYAILIILLGTILVLHIQIHTKKS